MCRVPDEQGAPLTIAEGGRLGDKQTRLTQHCFILPGPPNFGESLQNLHSPQSAALQALHVRHRRFRGLRLKPRRLETLRDNSVYSRIYLFDTLLTRVEQFDRGERSLSDKAAGFNRRQLTWIGHPPLPGFGIGVAGSPISQ